MTEQPKTVGRAFTAAGEMLDEKFDKTEDIFVQGTEGK